MYLNRLKCLQWMSKIGPWLIGLVLFLFGSFSQAQVLLCEQIIFQKYRASERSLFQEFPLLKKRFDTAWALNSRLDLNPSVQEFSKIKFSRNHKSNPYEKLRVQSVDIQNTVVAVYNRMNDSKAFAKYIQNLLIETAEFMKSRGRAEDLELLEQGRVTRSAALKVLFERMKKRNIEVRALRSLRDPLDFQKHVSQMAFIDYPFKQGNRHGRDTHLMQVDYVYDVVYQNMNGKPLEFYQFLGSPKGIWFWFDLFDAQLESDLRYPEFFGPKVRSTVPMY